MKKLIILLIFIISAIISSNLFAQQSIPSTGVEYSRQNKTFSATKVSDNKPEQTDYKWEDSKGNEYPIYITSNGACYIIRISKKTNKEYKQYLPKEVSIEICRELHREYKSKNK